MAELASFPGTELSLMSLGGDICYRDGRLRGREERKEMSWEGIERDAE